VQVPMFFNRQVFLKTKPGSTGTPSGMVTSATNDAQSQYPPADTLVTPSFPAGAISVNSNSIDISDTSFDFRFILCLLQKLTLNPTFSIGFKTLQIK
jgi:hypothetical protein